MSARVRMLAVAIVRGKNEPIAESIRASVWLAKCEEPAEEYGDPVPVEGGVVETRKVG